MGRGLSVIVKELNEQLDSLGAMFGKLNSRFDGPEKCFDNDADNHIGDVNKQANSNPSWSIIGR